MQNLQTDIPSFIKEIFNNGQIFSGIVIDGQNQFLKLLVNDYMDNFKNLKFNNLVENATIILNYLAKFVLPPHHFIIMGIFSKKKIKIILKKNSMNL